MLTMTSGASARQLDSDRALHETVVNQANSPYQTENTSIMVAAISAASASAIAKAAYGGQVLRVNRSQNEFRVKLQTQSGVIIVRVHAETGQILGVIN